MFSTIVAVLGTLAGAALAGWLQQRGQREERRAQAAADHRRQALDAVTALVTALTEHRKSMWLREDLRLNDRDWSAAREASHATRAAITAPSVAVAVLLPALREAADRAAKSTYALRGAADSAALDQARAEALAATEHLTGQAAQLLSA